MTQEFHLSITSLGSDRYLIRTEDSATGVPVAEAQVNWPVEEWLQLAQPALDDPLVGLLQGKVNLSDRAAGLHQLGSKLYNALFQDDAIRESWLRAQGIAQNRHEILRLRLGLKESRLQRLPWEVLQHGGQPLTTRTNLTFARYVANLLSDQLSEVKHLPDADAPIQVLMVIASPQDQDRLKLLQEVRQVQTHLLSHSEEVLPIRIHILEQPDRSLLAQRLEQGNYQVFHYAGHSDFGSNGGDLSLVNRQTGLTERLTGDDLAGLLVNNHVALTVFNSCRSGHTGGDDAEMDWRQQNLVQALVNRGVPSVVAMAERIPDEVAIAFTRLFYHNLRQGYPIDLSLSRTRQGLFSAFGSEQHFWALPILYLQPEFDGYLTKRDREADEHLDPDALKFAELPPPVAVQAAPGPPPPETPPPPPQTPSPVEVVPPAPPPLPPSPPPSPTPSYTTQVEIPFSVETELEDDLAAFVKQLSGTTAQREEPPLPAMEDEILLAKESRRAGMEIYDALPEVPLQTYPNGEAAILPAMPLSAIAPAAAASPVTATAFEPVRSPQPRRAEKSLLIWFALGLVGVVGVIGLGFLAMGWNDNFLPAAPESVEPSLPGASPTADTADTLLAQAEQAIEEGRYADARQDLEQVLTQELTGQADASVTDAVWSLVRNSENPDLLYIRGRLDWQEIARLQNDTIGYDLNYQQRGIAAQAREAWSRLDATFIDGRVARGFAALALGDIDQSIENFEAALSLYDLKRQQQPDPNWLAPEDAVILHAYAGLVMAHTRAAELNPAGLSEDERLSQASPEEQDILLAEAEYERAIAQEYFLALRELDRWDLMLPSNLEQINASPETWSNWLWTPPLLTEWGRVYRDWDAETASSS